VLHIFCYIREYLWYIIKTWRSSEVENFLLWKRQETISGIPTCQAVNECGDMELAATHTARFSAMHSATTRVLQLYPAVLTALKDVCKRPEDFDAAARAESEGLLTRFSDFETLITLIVSKRYLTLLGPQHLSPNLRVKSRAMCS